MKKYSLALAIIPTLLFAACSPTDTPLMQKKTEAMEKAMEAGNSMMDKGTETMDKAMEKAEGIMDETNDAMMKKEAGMYKDNTASLLADTVVMDGTTKVLFFHASWCPTCKAADSTLVSMYADEAGKLTTYKINYDTEKALAKKYGVTYQHTFVKVDGKGNMIEKIQGPSNDQLETLLQS